MLNRYAKSGQRRRGVILLVVLALLTTFTLVGLSFALYADGQARRASLFSQSASQTSPGGQKEKARELATAAWNDFLGQFLYDCSDDDPRGIASALRGLSLARTMYGWNDGGLNDRPYTGTGRLGEMVTMNNGLPGEDGRNLINYTFFAGDNLRDPGRLGVRAGLTAAKGPLTGDLNVSYTYPDRNNVFLARLDPTTGQVTMPSYHRPYLLTGGALDRYKSLRYLPANMGPGFPALSGIGDVKNLDGLPGGADAVWIDIGAPVHVDAEGRKFKVLVAPLVLDMDGRVNVNTAGNILAAGNTHASHQGWGPWEVNPARLGQPVNAAEWAQLITGAGGVPGRYGPGGLPLGTPVPGGTAVGNQFPVDFNGVFDPGSPAPRTPSPRFSFPGEPNTVQFQTFPHFDLQAYGNVNYRETTSDGTPTGTPIHPASFNALRPTVLSSTQYNRKFGPADLAGVLRLYNTGGERMHSSLFELIRTNVLVDPRPRFLLTTHSFDMDRPGSVPLVWDPNEAGKTYAYNPALGAPIAAQESFHALGGRTNMMGLAGSGEYDAATWRSALPGLRIDLRRQLMEYPAADATGRIDMTNMATALQLGRAVADRQALARDLFNRLRAVTGAQAPGTAAVGSNEFHALRYLAQLAVNIVDFTDNDDYSTPFLWYTDGTTNHYVFGTELPRLVINEYYAQVDNDHPDMGVVGAGFRQITNYRLNVWAELHNPGQAGVRLSNCTRRPSDPAYNAATDGWPMYRLRLQPNVANMSGPDNVLGNDPTNPVGAQPPAAGTTSIVDDWDLPPAMGGVDKQIVQANYGAYNGAVNNNQGFYVVGPNPLYPAVAPDLSGTDPKIQAKETHAPRHVNNTGDYQMSIRVPVVGYVTPTPSLVLERLANPALPPNTNPADPLYNPYIAVDYVQRLRVEDGRLHDDAGNAVAPAAVTDRSSYGRPQPYAAFDTAAAADPTTSMWQRQKPVAMEVRNSFFRHNAWEDVPAMGAPTLTPYDATNNPNQTLRVPFDVLYHPNRSPISIAELLHVSGEKQHQLTQRFMLGTFATPILFGHRARWTDERTRLARLLDHVTLGTSAAGVAVNGRIPGKVNINTINDRAVFNALCDAVAGNHFTQAEVDAVWAALIASRNGGGPGAERPFLSLGTGSAAADLVTGAPRGVQDTLWRSGTAGVGTDDWDMVTLRVLEPGTSAARTNPMRRFELLTKLKAHLTTRSNVFAVWVTVGFFEVTNDTTQPIQLGAEMRWGDGQTIRHKMFALVDRTQMQVWPTTNAAGQPLCKLGAAVNGDGTAQAVNLLNEANAPATTNPIQNPLTGRGWVPTPGAIITIDPDTDNEETVELSSPAAGTFQAVFRRSHAAGATVISRGNPGPWTTPFNPRLNPEVVLYSSLFE